MLRKGWTSKVTCRLGVLNGLCTPSLRHSIVQHPRRDYTNVNVNVNVNCVNIDSLFSFFPPSFRLVSAPISARPLPSAIGAPCFEFVTAASFPFSVPSPVSVLLRSICTYFILYRSCPLSTFSQSVAIASLEDTCMPLCSHHPSICSF